MLRYVLVSTQRYSCKQISAYRKIQNLIRSTGLCEHNMQTVDLCDYVMRLNGKAFACRRKHHFVPFTPKQ